MYVSVIILVLILVVFTYVLLANESREHSFGKFFGIIIFGTFTNYSMETNSTNHAFGVGETLGDNYSEFANVQNINYENDLPYVTEYVSSLLSGNNTVVVNGMMVATNTQATDLQFSASGGIENRLEIKPIQRYDTTFLDMEGSSGNTTVGFHTKNLDYHGQYISLIIGNVIKSRDGQIVFVIDVKGNKGDYQLVFVHGPLNIYGWHGNY